jgi:hypothetical protein
MVTPLKIQKKEQIPGDYDVVRNREEPMMLPRKVRIEQTLDRDPTQPGRTGRTKTLEMGTHFEFSYVPVPHSC